MKARGKVKLIHCARSLPPATRILKGKGEDQADSARWKFATGNQDFEARGKINNFGARAVSGKIFASGPKAHRRARLGAGLCPSAPTFVRKASLALTSAAFAKRPQGCSFVARDKLSGLLEPNHDLCLALLHA